MIRLEPLRAAQGCVTLLVLGSAGFAWAEEGSAAVTATAEAPAKPDESQEASKLARPTPPKRSAERRPVPNYDGRGADEATLAEGLLWVPRVAFSPLYFVSEYIVRRPLGYVATAAERGDWPAILIDFFTFGPDKEVGIVPTALLDFGFRPSVGLYVFSDNTFAEGNNLRFRAAYGAADWRQLVFSDRLALSPNNEVSLRAEYLQRPDWVFHGFGPDTADVLESRFLREELSVGVRYRHDWWRSSVLDVGVAVRDVSYDLGAGCCEEPNLQSRVFSGAIANPPGAADGFLVLTSDGALTLDTRGQRAPAELPEGSDFVSPPGTGIKASLRASHNIGLDDRIAFPGERPHQYHWLNYGATLGGFVDLTGQQRSLGLALVADFTEPLSDEGAVPFDEHVSLGGPRPLSGFLEGRLRGRSAVAALATYSWPIWVWLDGTMHYGVGNVFAPDLDGFVLEKLRSSFGIGISATDSRDQAFQLLIAAGTETIEDGMAVETLRLVLGTTHGF